MSDPNSYQAHKLALLEPSPNDADGGRLIGRDPRKLTPDDFGPTPPMLAADAIRARCLDCCANQPGEVRKCVATDCALWAFRMTGRLPPRLKAAALGRATVDVPPDAILADEVAA